MHLQNRRRSPEPLKFPASTVEEGDRGVLRAEEGSPPLRFRCVVWREMAGVGRGLHGKSPPSSGSEKTSPFSSVLLAFQSFRERGKPRAWTVEELWLGPGPRGPRPLFLFFLFFRAVRWARFAWAVEVELGPSARDWPMWPSPSVLFFYFFSFLFNFKFEFEFKFKSDFDQLFKQGHPIYDFGVV